MTLTLGKLHSSTSYINNVLWNSFGNMNGQSQTRGLEKKNVTIILQIYGSEESLHVWCKQIQPAFNKKNLTILGKCPLFF